MANPNETEESPFYEAAYRITEAFSRNKSRIENRINIFNKLLASPKINVSASNNAVVKLLLEYINDERNLHHDSIKDIIRRLTAHRTFSYEHLTDPQRTKLNNIKENDKESTPKTKILINILIPKKLSQIIPQKTIKKTRPKTKILINILIPKKLSQIISQKTIKKTRPKTAQILLKL